MDLSGDLRIHCLESQNSVQTAETVMPNVNLPSDRLNHWRDLYVSALFETDRIRLPKRIAEAEHAIVARARELFSANTDTIEEDQALDDALYSLRALQNCLELRAASHLETSVNAGQWVAD
jgi:hypothetical protein